MNLVRKLIQTYMRNLTCSLMTCHIDHQILYLASVCEKNSTFWRSSQTRLYWSSKVHFSGGVEQSYDSKSSFVKSASHPMTASANYALLSRSVKSEVQAAFFDYLHCTRGLSFVEAEHISRNAPIFLHKLVAKVENEEDVSRALSKFLRYHPINEFEPFFESLGLKPKEFESLLPQQLIFLSDDQVLLHNYHALSTYGVPRSKIGKMCKEAAEIFTYGYGVLDRKLRAYEELGLSKSMVIKTVSCSPRLLVDEPSKALAGILEILREVGFGNDWIGGYLSSKNEYNWIRILDTLCFLRYIGYNQTQIKSLLTSDAPLLFQGSGKEVYTIAGALLKLGLKVNEVHELFVNSPEIISPKSTNNFWKVLHLLFEIEMEPRRIAKFLSTHVKLLHSRTLRGPKIILKNFKNDEHSLRQMIETDPSSFLEIAFKSKTSSPELIAARNPKNIFEKVEFLTRLGYSENSDEMSKAMKVFRGRGDQLQERFDCLVKAGLDFNTVLDMVKQAPTVLNQSKDVLEKKIECLKVYLGYPIESIGAFPSYLCYDMARISTRFCMYRWLREKGAAKPMLSVSTLLVSSDSRFEKYYVDIHPQGRVVWENLKSSPPLS